MVYCNLLVFINKKEISLIWFAKDIGVTEESVWFMLQRIREIESNCGGGGFDKNSIVILDECYVDGRYKNMHTSKKKLNRKIVVIGMVERSSKTRESAMKVPTSEKDFLLPKINLNAKQDSIIVIDSYQTYKDLKKKYKHKTIKHRWGKICILENIKQKYIALNFFYLPKLNFP